MANKITNEQIEKINELYLKLKTYAAVSRALGGSPSPTTIKKYIIPGYISKKSREEGMVKFDTNLLEKSFDMSDLVAKDFAALCVLTVEEKEKIIGLWRELGI